MSPRHPHGRVPPAKQDGIDRDAPVQLNLKVPEYISAQLEESARQLGCTHGSLVLRILAAFRGKDGRPVFHIDEKDLPPR
jgi:hypothetical protein